MSTLKRNIAANYAGSGWTALVNIAFIPVYIRLLGIEAFGLIGFFSTLQGIFSLLDLGVSATISRELARLSVLPEKKQEMRDLSLTLELIYWAVAVCIGMTVVFCAPLISRYWINSSTLSQATTQQAIMLMGGTMLFRWPYSYYYGGLMGLQRQTLFNVVKIVTETLRGAGVILVLWLVAPTVQVFFVWQLMISIGSTGILAYILRSSLPPTGSPSRYNTALLRDVWRFAAGMTGISLTVVVLTQLDKIILSMLLSLELFGYYSLASTVAAGLFQITTPVYQAVYPKFVQLATMGDGEGLKSLYHKSCQIVSMLIIPVSIVVAFFSPEILFLWTRNAVTVEKSHILLSILIIGTALNGLMNMPYALQLAHGMTKLSLYVNIVSIAVLAPFIVFMVKMYGASGAAFAWLLLNAGYFMIIPPIMHRYLLIGEKTEWYVNDIMKPLAAVLIGTLIARMWLPSTNTRLWPMMITVSSVFVGVFALSAVSMPVLRLWLKSKLVTIWE